MSSTTEKKKKSKLEKIYELQAANKGLKEENRNLRKELQAKKEKGSGGGHEESHSATSSVSHNEEKLMEAMKALKRVTVKQEMSLNTIRSKAEQRRKELALRDEVISRLEQELSTLKKLYEERKEADASGDVGILRERVEELAIRCSELENKNKMLTFQIEASEEKAKNFSKQLESARGLMNRSPSGRSLKSNDTSVSEYDMAKMRKELASKIEKIVLLEFDLEMCMDELHELKQKHKHGEMGSAARGGQAPAYQDEFFSDDDDEDEDW